MYQYQDIETETIRFRAKSGDSGCKKSGPNALTPELPSSQLIRVLFRNPCPSSEGRPGMDQSQHHQLAIWMKTK